MSQQYNRKPFYMLLSKASSYALPNVLQREFSKHVYYFQSDTIPSI